MRKKNLLTVLYFISMIALVTFDLAGKLTHSQFWFGFLFLDIIYTLVV